MPMSFLAEVQKIGMTVPAASALGRAGGQLFRAHVAFEQVFLHECIITLDDRVHQFGTCFRQINQRPSRGTGRRHQHIDDAAKLGPLTDGHVEHHAAFAEGSLNRAEQVVEADVVRIHLVDNQHAGAAAAAGFREHPAHVHFDAVGCRDNDRTHSPPGRGLRGRHPRNPGSRACRGINLLALVLQMQNAGVDREMAFLLFLVVVGNARAVFDTAAAVHRPGFE